MALTILHRKLGRDLWRIRAQAFAIAAVVAMGVMVQVMMAGLTDTLTITRDAYFERHRFAQIFEPLTRAPNSLMEKVNAIPGVLTTDGRLSGYGRIDADGGEPVQARILSLPGPAGLNGILMTAGRMPVPGRSDEVILLDTFAAARGIALGDTFGVTVEGRHQHLRVVGFARSPEFLFMPAPGEFFPTDGRFSVIWMERKAAAAVLDLDGAFNEVLVLTTRERPRKAVLADLDRLMAPYGGGAGYVQDQQTSARFIEEELKGLRQSRLFLPPIFLAVAAFLLNVTITRIVQAERREIGLMKAFGHSGAEIAGHYLELALLIALAGAVLGSGLGVMAGRAITGLYMEFYKFPYLVFSMRPGPFAGGLAFSLLAAALGAAIALRTVFRLTPAEAMRPPAPPDFTHGRIGFLALLTRPLDQPGRMILRQITRQPFRSLGTIGGVAAGLALNMAMLMIYAGFDHTMAVTFGFADRSDATVSFIHPVSRDVTHEIAHLPGVLEAEPQRMVPVLFRNGPITHRGELTGLPDPATLNRALDTSLNPIPLPANGVVLSRGLANLLALHPGDLITAEVTEGRKRHLTLPVVAVSDTLLGAPAYMRLDALTRAIGEADRITSVALRTAGQPSAELLHALRERPKVAGVSVKADSYAAFRKIADEGAGQMRFVFGAIAFVLSFGIVYNAARNAFAERVHELASLRVLGFTRAEVTLVLAGEIAVLVAIALPLGIWLGWWLANLIAVAFSNELYRVSVSFDLPSIAKAVLVVVAAMLASILMLRRAQDRLNMVAALKARD
ncbi:ABC transporter permease [Thioclava sp. L04-15]|uniref:ABC transporter permease n=1 Tax=Thioclava sp. L04-15 TaxID=1915318 RepID=UPI000997B218|nr:ABC transporter permease [Thioclava sp. L04-15]TNE83965.1 MAG: ABC transporter permease [Paracoccaceae bacterium]